MGKSHSGETLVEAIRNQVGIWGGRIAIRFLKDGEDEIEAITYSDLDNEVRVIAANMLQSFRAGDRILLLLPQGPQFIKYFLACMYAKIVAVPAYPPASNRHRNRIERILADCSPSGIIIDSIESWKRIDPDGSFQDKVSVPDPNSFVGHTTQWEPPPINPNDCAMIQYTSGSTSQPRGVILSHGNLIENQRMINGAMRIDSSDKILSWLPLYHDMGLIGCLLQPLFAGSECILMPPNAFLQKPARWFDAIAKYKATVTGAPNFALDLCNRKISENSLSPESLASIRLLFCGAEPIRAGTINRFYEKFKVGGLKKKTFFPCYGLAEASLFVSGDHSFQTKKVPKTQLELNKNIFSKEDGNEKEIFSCGTVADKLTVAIVDPETLSPLDSGKVGEILIGGGNVSCGYWNRAEENYARFGIFVNGHGAIEFFRTGDLGLLAGGSLFVTGRIKDLIIVNGVNLYPQDIEDCVIGAADDLSTGIAIAFSLERSNGSEGLVVLMEAHRTKIKYEYSDVVKSISKEIFDEFSVPILDFVVVGPGKLPRTSSGKVQRLLAKAMYIDQQFDPIYSMSVPGHTTSRENSDQDGYPELNPAQSQVASVTELPKRESVVEEAAQVEPLQPAEQSAVLSLLQANPDRASSLDVEDKKITICDPEQVFSLERVKIFIKQQIRLMVGPEINEVRDDSPFSELRLDSVNLIELVAIVESEFGLKLPENFFQNCSSICEAAKEIHRTIVAAHANNRSNQA